MSDPGALGGDSRSRAGVAHHIASASDSQHAASPALAPRVAGVIAVAMVLVITSGLMDGMRSLEGTGGLWLLNILVATPIALVLVSTTALVIAALLDREPHLSTAGLARRLLTPAVGLGGIGVGAVILITSRVFDLASWIGVGGSVLLVLAALTQHKRTLAEGRSQRS